MSDHPTPHQPGHDSHDLTALNDSAKTHALFCYCMLGVGYFTGIFWFVGGIWAMVKIGDFRQSRYEDHFANIIKVFWWSLGLMIIGWVTMFILIGWLVWLGTFIWSLFRLVKGVSQLTSNRSYHSAG